MQRPDVDLFLLHKRYCQPGESTWEDVAARVARHAGGDDAYLTNEFYVAIRDRLFLPSRMPYMGTDYPFASSCFVFPVDDSLSSIMKTLSDACQVQKHGGGTGYNFSRLRPAGDRISTTGGEASGPVSFMRLYHHAMEVVNRAGKKHAAQMGILNCDHPDIFEFIRCKDAEGALWTFNISVGITDNFMRAVKRDESWHLQFNGQVYRTIRARELWDAIVEHAWHNGDPGVIFLDTVNKNNCYPEPIEACNPCGEQMLPPYVSCNLGSIDLSRCVGNDGEIDWATLYHATRIGVEFLDRSVANAKWPVPEIEEKTRRYRNIGLGVMGWADMLILLGIPYDSMEAVETASQVMEFIQDAADETSRRIGGGVRVNTTLTSIAPTGSISMLAGCSSGIEPIFGIVTVKNTYVGRFISVHWPFEYIARELGFYSRELIDTIAERGSVQGLADVPEDIQELFKTATEIEWIWHVRHQAAFQRHVDNAVSKTINMANNATPADVADAYMMAWETGCKSITVYRDGSRQVQVVENRMQMQQKDDLQCAQCGAQMFMADGRLQCLSCNTVKAAPPPTKGGNENPRDVPATRSADKYSRPLVLSGRTYKQATPVGQAYVTINSNGQGPSDPLEVFLNVGKAGSEVSAMSEAMGRLISLLLRIQSDVSRLDRLAYAVDELREIGGSRPVGFGPHRVMSLPDGVARVLSQYLEFAGYNTPDAKMATIEMRPATATDQTTPAPTQTGDICPDCGGATLIYAEGCRKCVGCGYSEC